MDQTQPFTDSTQRQQFSSGTSWEATVGYSRAIRVGQWIEVSGTVAADVSGQVVGPGDPYTQTRFILDKIDQSLVALGSKLQDVIRTRIYVTDRVYWEAIAQAHRAAFKDIAPASTLVQVQGLITPDYLVEIEATAVIQASKADL